MGTRILIAENDCATRGLLTEWLESAGYDCVPTPVAEALEEADLHRPDAVLVGVDTAEGERMRIAERLASVPAASAVIVLSRPDLAIALEASRFGAVDCLPWPTSARGIVDSVERAVRRRESKTLTRVRRHSREAAMAQAVDQLKTHVAGAHADVAQRDLLALLESRHPDTHQHSVRVASAAAALARELRLPYEQATEIKRAALLHDIGKLAIPSALLESAAPLSDDDMAMLRMHAAIGAEVLDTVPGLAAIAALVGATHERHDGNGYPLCLRGVDIPLGARIIAVVDVYDALTSIRPYREPLTHDEANLELARVAGSQLDPDVVRAWILMTEYLPCC